MSVTAHPAASPQQRMELARSFGPARTEPGDIYRRLGVEPIINCAGVRTNYGGSNPSDEVLAAMAAAAEAFVDLDELAEGIGRRLAELTQAEWGTVTAGTAAALALCTAACIAGNDPELMLRLPDTRGVPNQVLIPLGQRFAYDSAIRMVGARVLSVADPDHLQAALSYGEVAMVCLLGRADPASSLPLRTVAPIARQYGVPILVDAAGLRPASPDPWLAGGADLVVYSGGKYLRGPQSTGLLLGAKRLCQAAWVNGAPHQAFGRPMKVGKEEMVGAVVALEQWFAHGGPPDRGRWQERLSRIVHAVTGVPGIQTKLLAASASVSAERLEINWDLARLPVDPGRLRTLLLDQQPRVLIHDFWSGTASIVIDPVNLSDHEADIVGTKLSFAFENAAIPDVDTEPKRSAEHLNFSGIWETSINFLHGSVVHELALEQDPQQRLLGWHKTRFSIGAVEGHAIGRYLRLVARHPQEPTSLFYTLEGVQDGDVINGTVRVGAATDEHRGAVFEGQFGQATWSARRRPDTLRSPSRASGG